MNLNSLIDHTNLKPTMTGPGLVKLCAEAKKVSVLECVR